MAQDDTEIVTALSRALANRVGAERFSLWFAGQVQWRIEGATLLLEATPFTLHRLRRDFKLEIELAWQEVIGQGALVKYLNTADINAALNTAEPSATADPANLPSLPFEPVNLVSQAMLFTEANAGTTGDASPVEVAAKGSPKGRRAKSHTASLTAKPVPAITNKQASLGSWLPFMLEEQPVPATNVDASAEVELEATGGFSRRKFASFSTLGVGEGNRLAHNAAMQIINRPGEVSPLFLHGPSGVGKTHLVEALWSEYRRRYRDRRIVYLTAEQFTTHFLDSLHSKGLPSFRARYRGVDLLVIDDLQFFSGKPSTINELMYTVDSLMREGKQLVFTADRPPNKLPFLGEQLIQRLSSGLTCAIRRPCETVGKQIAMRLAYQRKIPIQESLLSQVAEHTQGDIRVLQGVLNYIEASCLADDRAADQAMVEEAISEIAPAGSGVVRLTDIDRAVCEVFGLPEASLQSQKKSKDLQQPRTLAMWLAKKFTRSALAEIGGYFGRRSHSSVISANRRINDWLKSGEGFQLHGRKLSLDEAIRLVESALKTG